MIAIIRISGKTGINGRVAETMEKLKMLKKYTCVIVDENPETFGMIKKVRNCVAYGKIDEKTLAQLIKMRGKIIGNSKEKVKDAEKTAKEVLSGKKLEDLNIKPFFGLHPARGGIDTKHHAPKGVLGEHRDINKLIERML